MPPLLHRSQAAPQFAPETPITTGVPEPASLALLSVGLLGTLVARPETALDRALASFGAAIRSKEGCEQQVGG